MAKVLNFHHAGLAVPKARYQEIKDFYCDLFGYTAVFEDFDRGCTYVEMSLGDGTWLELVDLAETMPPLADDADSVFEHVCFEVDDIRGFMDEAVKKGCSVLFGPLETKFCGKKDILVSYLKGIGGEIIEITQEV